LQSLLFYFIFIFFVWWFSERYHPQTRSTKQEPVISLQMMEVYNELIKDLLLSPQGSNTGLLDITETPEQGVHARVSMEDVL
jgi:hypothetical protein